ncbi:MAG: hypothetical protein MUF31_12540 [Akkermansiaceae bacterium]|jgi:hypothetical protein|nr:hypothetical protein [Akkermansiaceae bacterium]
MIHPSILLRVLLLLGLGISSIHAQDAKAAREVRIRLLAFEPRLQKAEIYLHDPAAENGSGVKGAIRTYLNHQSVMVPLVGNKLVITDDVARESLTEEGRKIAEATLPGDCKSAILLVLPGEAGAKVPCRVLAVPDLENDFPAGSFHVSNFSPSAVRIVLEKNVYPFKPGEQRLIQDPPARENQQIGMRTFTQDGENWKQVANGLWTHPGKRRSLMVLFLNPSSGHVELRAFDDIEPRPLPEAKPRG